jgi:dienelactone hydrolase
MKHLLLITTAAVGGLAAATIVLPCASAAQAPPMGGGYTNVIPIPVEGDPQVKAIAGALFKPEGAGPFPAIIYLNGCRGLDYPPDRATQKAVIDHALSKGFATLILDSFTPRGETKGMCDQYKPSAELPYGKRGADDLWAAFKLMSERPDVDPKRIFIEGYDFGAFSALFATTSPAAAAREPKPAGVIAYYPHCGFSTFAVPTLIIIGDKDGIGPLVICQARSGKPNVEVVVYPGATHDFAAPGMDDTFDGDHLVYDAKAAQDAQARADAFIAAHMK